MDSVRDIHCWMGCPIRRSRDQRALASTPGFSQRATSFIASRCQGIHQMPLPQRLIAKTRRLQRQALHNDMLSREDTHSKKPEARKPEARKLPVSSRPNLLDIHRSIRLAPNTTLVARRRLGSLPLHPVKDHTRKSQSSGANSSSRSILRAPRRALSRCKRTAVALCDH